MNKRALYIALFTSLLGALLLVLYFQRFERERSGGERVKLVMATKIINRGSPISEDMITVREVPISYVEDRTVKWAERAKVIGLRVGTTVQPNQLVMWTDLAITGDEHRDLSSLIPPGNRAAQIHAAGDGGGATLIQPGDYVDVIATLDKGNERRSSIVVLQRVLVLAVGLDIGGDPQHRGAGRDSVLTVSVDLPQAQLLAYAQTQGRLSVAVRPPDDQRTVQAPPAIEAFPGDAKRAVAAPAQPGKPDAPVKVTNMARDR